MNNPREARHFLLLRRFTGVLPCLVSWFFVLAGLPVLGQGEPRYRFEAGEPLTYKLRMAVSNDTSADAQLFDLADKSGNRGRTELEMDYQLMPISQREDGLWKVRLVLSNLRQMTDRDGITSTNTLDREALRRQQFDVSELMKVKAMEGLGRRRFDDDTNNATPPQLQVALAHTPEDLLYKPILLWIAPEGTVRSLEERAELQQIMGGLNLKECLDLTMPPLLGANLLEGTAWTREVPVDLPTPPLARHEAKPMILKLEYKVESIEKFEGRPCARIRVAGHFAEDKLRIPINEEEKNYLIWTTFITAITDHLEGEFFFDLEQGVVKSSDLKSRYTYSTLRGRKVDNYKYRVLTKNAVDTRITSRLIPEPIEVLPVSSADSFPAAGKAAAALKSH